jgi:hypothetical protein
VKATSHDSMIADNDPVLGTLETSVSGTSGPSASAPAPATQISETQVFGADVLAASSSADIGGELALTAQSSEPNLPASKPAAKTLDTDFSFVPKNLAVKCQRLIETYHAINGYACLPDMLWQPELRDFIEMHKDFRQIFKRASTTRSAKKANDGFVLIATTILSLEVLASDFASWSARFPTAKRRAAAILQEYTLNSRTWLMDRYLYPRSYINPAFINALSPPDSLRPGPRDIGPDAIGGNLAAVD